MSRGSHHFITVRSTRLVTVLSLILLFESLIFISWSDRNRISWGIFIVQEECTSYIWILWNLALASLMYVIIKFSISLYSITACGEGGLV